MVKSTSQDIYLFDENASLKTLNDRIKAGAVIKRTQITDEFNWDDFNDRYNNTALPLFIIRNSGQLQVVPAQDTPKPKAGQVLISLVDQSDEDREKALDKKKAKNGRE